MPTLNLQINAIAFSDTTISNNPTIRNFDVGYKLLGQTVVKPKSDDYEIAPGASQLVFSGVRTTSIDGTTAFTISQPYIALPGTYRFAYSSGALPVFRNDRALGEDTTTQIVATVNGPLLTLTGASTGLAAAFFTGTIGGMTTSVTITAQVPGTAGNSINIPPDGTSSITTLLANWNTNNPSQLVVLTSGDGTQIPTGGTFQLAGGTNTTAINTSAVVVGDVLNIGPGSGFSVSNQGQFTIIAKSSTSLTVQNLNAVAETVTILDPTQFIAYSNGGGTSNQIQIGDTVIISAGFSLVTQGTYTVTNVTPTYFEIEIAAPNGIPLETGIIPGVSGLVFYSSAKQFVMVAAQQKCSVQVNADTTDNNLIEPVEFNNPERPGLYMKQGTVYSLTIHNLSLETLSVIVATAE